MDNSKSFQAGDVVTIKNEETGAIQKELTLLPAKKKNKINFSNQAAPNFSTLNNNNESLLMSCVESPRSIFVLMYMTNFLSYETNLCTCTQHDIANNTGIDKSNLSRAITHLVKVKLLRKYDSKKLTGWIINPEFIFAGKQYYARKKWSEACEQLEEKNKEKSRKVDKLMQLHSTDKILNALEKLRQPASFEEIEEAEAA